MRERALKAADDWVWIPPDAEDYIEADYRLTVYPDRTSVQWSTTERPLDEVIAEVRERARGTNPVLRWWVKGHTKPDNTAAILLDHGFELVETVEVLARQLSTADDLRSTLNPPSEIEVRPANTPDLIYLAGQIDAEVFDWPAPTPLQLQQESDSAAKAMGSPETGRYLAYVHNQPIGTAGFTITDGVLRLWGGGVLAKARGRGAYRALLAARCAQGVAKGATLALVKGRIATSAPILRRAGFTSYGTEQCYQGALPT
ncbi:GNAT family N-acetyltransferase [Kribbella qitaiheensis]|uniref:GNAT family N-acetyltransferase n=1 Tax=Kribbella qitaiheensis TaxID=1544730 RepID=A0A7G6WX66_9ACTN|nr:GNAT family N-acetyltransferase [Kribbella qitaiheensis]QNE18581.1 GNAT family N-acetyltransferase [Kribbella qitaiheensis]